MRDESVPRLPSAPLIRGCANDEAFQRLRNLDLAGQPRRLLHIEGKVELCFLLSLRLPVFSTQADRRARGTSRTCKRRRTRQRSP